MLSLPSPDHPLNYARSRRARFVSELKGLVHIPSISAQPRHAGEVKRCAAWVADHLCGLGPDQLKVFSTPRHPIVYAAWRQVPGRPTVLLYGHYDVQPVDPLSAWRSPPFEPTIRGNDLYGRGASDDKGQLFVHVKAVESYLKTVGRLPVNVKFLFEGEEEIGSPHLLPFLRQNREALAANVAVVSDTRMLAPDRPAITYALRGSLSLELRVRGPRHDLHSGAFGGTVHNPVQALSEILARLHDAGGRVAIPGFYDRVRPIQESERSYLRRVGPRDDQILRDAGTSHPWGENGYSLYERTTLRPALTINGIEGGYSGSGHKSVIPATAAAKLNFRLVSGQDPREIERLFRRHITRIVPPAVTASVHASELAAHPVMVDRDHPAMRAATEAYRGAFGRAAVFLRSGGSIPVVSTLQTELGIPTVLMGFALPNDRMHAPNEKFHLPNFFKGIETSIRFLDLLGKLHGSPSAS